MSNKYWVNVVETTFHTYKVSVPDGITVDDVEGYFLNLTPDAKEKMLIISDCFEMSVDNIEIVKED